MNRRRFLQSLGVVGLGALGAAGYRYWPEAGWKNPCNSPTLPATLHNHPLIQQAFAGVDFSKVWDMHAHLVGVGDSGTGIRINPEMHSMRYPMQYIQREFYLNAACATDAGGTVDDSYTARLRMLAGGFPAGFKLMLYAFDRFYDEAGTVRAGLRQFMPPIAPPLRSQDSRSRSLNGCRRSTPTGATGRTHWINAKSRARAR